MTWTARKCRISEGPVARQHCCKSFVLYVDHVHAQFVIDRCSNVKSNGALPCAMKESGAFFHTFDMVSDPGGQRLSKFKSGYLGDNLYAFSDGFAYFGMICMRLYVVST